MSAYIPLPEAFSARVISEQFPPAGLLEALETAAPTAIRLHPRKKHSSFEGSQQIPWSEYGLLLAERPIFTLDPLFHAGCYYPQEAGSQFIDTILRQIPLPEHPVVLDLCAAPGGKSTLLASFLDGNGFLVSNEIVPNRARILKENLSKWGYANVVVTQNEPAQFEKCGTVFDLILADVPCSGEGMFRKDFNARAEWSEQNVQMCAVRQQQIIEDIWPTLSPGGLLIYSTCTFNAFENEQNIQWICDELGGELVPIELEQATRGRNGIGYYAVPGSLETEGFFVAVIRKLDDDILKTRPVKKTEVSEYSGEKTTIAALADLSGIELLQWKEFLFGVPNAFTDLVKKLQTNLRVVKMGIEIGEISRKGLIPHEDLALSISTLSENVQQIPLSRQEALQYLKGETFPLEGKPGYAVVTYENQPIGWIKHLGNRFNNLYPKEWRIRMEIR